MRNIHTIFWHAFLLCVSVSGMGIGGPGLQLFITVPLPSVMLVSSPPTATTFFSSRVGNVCYFVTPEGVNLFHTTILTRLSLSYSPHFSHREAWVCKKAKNPWMIAIYMLHSSVQRLEAVLNSPHGCAVLTPGQLQPPDSKEREMSTTVHYIFPTVPSPFILSPSFPFPGIENRHSVTGGDTLWRDFYFK